MIEGKQINHMEKQMESTVDKPMQSTSKTEPGGGGRLSLKNSKSHMHFFVVSRPHHHFKTADCSPSPKRFNATNESYIIGMGLIEQTPHHEFIGMNGERENNMGNKKNSEPIRILALESLMVSQSTINYNSSSPGLPVAATPMPVASNTKRKEHHGVSLPGAFRIYPKGFMTGDSSAHDSISSYQDDSESVPTPPPPPVALPHFESTLFDVEAQQQCMEEAIREAREKGRQEGLQERNASVVKAIPVDDMIEPRKREQQQRKRDQDEKKILPRYGLSTALMLVLTIAIIVSVTWIIIKKEQHHSRSTNPLSSSPPSSSSTTTLNSRQCFENRTILLDAIDAYLLSPTNHTYSITYGLNIMDWCVTKVQVFDSLFSTNRNPAIISFDGDLSQWDMSNAISTVSLFAGARRFKGTGIDHWNMSSVINMSYMFDGCWSLDANLSHWDVSNVQTMRSTFRDASKFRGNGLDQWNVSQVYDMTGLFHGASWMDINFSQWDVSQVKSTPMMFANTTSFRGIGLQYWNVSQVEDMVGMFMGTSSSAFYGSNLSNWDVGHVTNMSLMFAGSTYELDDIGLQSWDVSNVVDMSRMFWQVTKFTGSSIQSWTTSQVIDMSGMFYGASMFDTNLSTYDVSRVVTMQSMFQGAINFHGIGLNVWNVSNVQHMGHMFTNTVIDIDFSGWDVSQVKVMEGMFDAASLFTGKGLDRWDVSRVTNMAYMFHDASLFDADLSLWDISNVSWIIHMFHNAISFRGFGGLHDWNLSKIDCTFYMFANATNFLGIGLDQWNTSTNQGANMMFYGASSFDSNLTHWDVAKVVTMSYMFANATNFHGIGLEMWNTSHVIDMSHMLDGAIRFNTSLCSWGHTMRNDTNTSEMFYNTSCPSTKSPEINWMMINHHDISLCYSCE